MPQLIKEYVDTGKLRVVIREFPIPNLHPRAFAAARAAVCAGAQDQYMEMHDLIFSDQKALSNADIKEGQSMGVSGTPSFVVGLTDPEDSNKIRVTRFIRGAQPLPTFQGAINDQLVDAAKIK